jgi:transposase
MRKTKEILRQKWELGRSHREVALSLGLSAGTIAATLARAQAAGLTAEQLGGLSEEALEEKLYGKMPTGAGPRPLPDCAVLDTELRRPGVSLQLLHIEYLQAHPDGYRYSQFCSIYRRWLCRRGLTMRQVHRGGEKLFVDYAGQKPHLTDPQTGELREVELFVAALGASSWIFAEATLTQRGPDFIHSHVRAFQAIGGVPEAVVPDQLKSGVTVACRYEPRVQRTYEEMAIHYGTTVLPARPAHPKDKAKVEVSVQVVERWILARLRNRTFFSLDALNLAITELCDELNDRPMRHYGQSRNQLFEKLDRPALRPLPAAPFVYAEWKRCKVNIDYHVQVEHHFYSVPHGLIHREIEARVSTQTVELFLAGNRVASHLRSLERGRHTTVAEHMPKAHQSHLEWSPSRLSNWAKSIGPNTQALVDAILTERRHPEQGYRSCLGILRLGKTYGNERLEAASERALAAGARSYRHLETILKNKLDRLPLTGPTDPGQDSTTPHPNVRGPNYYQ